jgi:hypothetical protein
MSDVSPVSDPVAPSAPVAPSRAAPSPGALPGPDVAAARATARERIAEIRADPSHPFHTGNAAAVDEVANLYATALGEPPPASSAPYQVEIPPGQTPETFDPIVQSIASAGTRAFGLSKPVADATIAWMLDARHPEPALPAGRAIPSRAVAESHLQERWREHYPRQMALAEAALIVLDETRGGPEGALRRRFRETGAANMPEVIQELANLGGLYAGSRDPKFRALVEHFEADYRSQSRPGRRP